MKVDLTMTYKLGLTPNQIYLLHSIKKGIEPKLINITAETGLLETEGFLQLGTLTSKGNDALVKATYLGRSARSKAELTATDIEEITRFREMFPNIKIPTSKKPARQPVRDLQDKFSVFFARYPDYRDWELIQNATAYYLDEFEKKKWNYMQTSAFFIIKDDQHKGSTSVLADYCQMILDGEPEENTQIAPSLTTMPNQL
jgi:hypothetical protein